MAFGLQETLPQRAAPEIAGERDPAEGERSVPGPRNSESCRCFLEPKVVMIKMYIYVYMYKYMCIYLSCRYLYR